MLKFTMKKVDPVDPPPLSGQRLGYDVFAGDVWLTDIWQEHNAYCGVWTYVDRLATHNKSAANPLHALELGIASSARWIAVELLKNPAPAETIEEAVDGVALWLRLVEKHDPAMHTVWSTFGELGVVGVSTIPPTHAPGACWWFSCPLALAPNGQRASQEQALAALIEHAAPWIAVVLEKELMKT